MAQKQTGIRMDAEVYRQLKIWAAESEITIGSVVGEMVERLAEISENRRALLQQAGLTEARLPTLSLGLMRDETIQELLDQAEMLKKNDGGWVGE